MKLAANLTIGWANIPASPFCAWKMHRQAVAAPDYERSLFHQLQLAKADTHIFGLDSLFRRTQGGFDSVIRFVEALADMPEIPYASVPLLCDVDLFAYTFLAETRHFERLLPLMQHSGTPLVQTLNDCQLAMQSLETFERTGTLPARMDELDAQRYLALRRAVMQPVAHDELKVLSALAISGPSKTDNLARELMLDKKKTYQILEQFKSIGIVSSRQGRPGQHAAETTFSISKVSIPLVMFVLKETLGLDLMSDLLDLVGASYG